MTANDERLLTTRELARRLAIGQGKVRSMVRDGLIPGVRIEPNGWRFDWNEVLRALREQRRTRGGVAVAVEANSPLCRRSTAAAGAGEASDA